MTVLIVVVAVGITVHTIADRIEERRLLDALESGGRTTIGQVTKLTHTRPRYVHTQTHLVHYDYAVAGRRYASKESVSSAWFHKLRVGNPVVVTYLPSDPNRAIARPIAQARSDAERERVLTNVSGAVLWAAVLWTVYVRMRNSDFAFPSVREWWE